ncbi:hypothetical protein GF366_03300, partial [Candidatus Peregrinibacteria bacterium]|nr:hypothetical protein [Candidatus Peregrinibacteria bacterium]
MRRTGPKVVINKISFLIVGSAFLTAILIVRLFQLQVLAHDYFQDIATREQYGYIELPAQRGEIIIKDYHSNEEFLLATNTTLNLVYADPTLIQDPLYVADKFAPLLFDIENERAADNERIEELSKNLPADLAEEELEELLKPLSDKELEKKFKQNLTQKLSEKQRKEILLTSNIEEESLAKIKSLSVPGIEIKENNVYAYPPQISSPSITADQIADYVKIPRKTLTTLLKGENRYIILDRKLSPEISEQIEELIDNDEKFLGMGLKEEYFRYYPEKSLAANVLGYVNRDNIGQYGIESTYNTKLKGVAGKFQTKKDSIGRQITVGESSL